MIFISLNQRIIMMEVDVVNNIFRCQINPAWNKLGASTDELYQYYAMHIKD